MPKGAISLKPAPPVRQVFPGDSGAKPMQQSPVSQDTGLIDEAVEVARQSDVVIACVGIWRGCFKAAP